MKLKLTLILCGSFLLGLAQPPQEGGIEFNGIDEFILMPDSDNINTRPVNNRTIETYFKVDDATNRQTIYKEGGQVNSIKFIVEGGYIYLGCYRDSGGPGELIFFRKPINNNTWYHVALVLDNASELKFYFNGVLQDSRPNFFQIPVHPGDFEIARSSGNTRYPACDTWTAAGSSEYCLDEISPNTPITNYFGGHIWGFRIWDVVRTASEINANKDILITDTSVAPGDDLIAFIDDDSMNYTDSNGNIDTEEVATDSVLGIEDVTTDDFRVYVQHNQLHVISNTGKIPERLSLFSLDGKRVVQVQNSGELSVSQLSGGIYILNISSDNKSQNSKVLIQN